MSHTIIALDVGGTKISAALVTPDGKIIKRARLATEATRGKAVVLANIIKAVETVWDPSAKAIGVGIAGHTDHKKGIYLTGPNLPKGLRNVALAALLRKHFKKPVSLDNDVHCFTLGESKFGKGKRFSTVVGLTLGTGIGGGIVINGQIYRGRNNAAGEIGHTILSLSSDIHCSCGKTGHFEAFGSGTAMSRLYRGERGLSPMDVENLYKSGDKEAKRVFSVMSDAIGAGIANVIHVLNPDIVVVGGGLAKVDNLWKPVEKSVKNHLTYPQLKSTPIVRSTLGGDANLLGAALITELL